MNILKLEIDEETFEIDVSETTSPNTLRMLKAFLPFRIELHYAKIAGEEVMAMMPFHAPLERAIEVAQAKPGMLAYWPRRQLLCLYYGKMQEEAAHINVLGHVENDLDKLAAYGEKVGKDQGKRLHYCDLYLESPARELSAGCPRHPFMDSYEEEIWYGMPEEIRKMYKKPGIMRPTGPVLYAETDTRVFHEFLTAARDITPEDSHNLLFFKLFLNESLRYFHNKMLGWYGLERTANTIEKYIESLDKCVSEQPLKSLLDSISLFVGRMNMWLDALIPWNEFNKTFQSRPLKRFM